MKNKIKFGDEWFEEISLEEFINSEKSIINCLVKDNKITYFKQTTPLKEWNFPIRIEMSHKYYLKIDESLSIYFFDFDGSKSNILVANGNTQDIEGLQKAIDIIKEIKAERGE